MPRDARGWRVAPAPDGRGTPDSPTTRAPHRSRGFALFAVVLLIANLASVLLLSPAGQPRVKVPFSPYFVSQVQAGRVASIRSTGDAIEGTFKSSVRYPTGDTKATPTTLFATEVPAFWNNDQLTALLQAHEVQINAQSTTQATSLLVSLLLDFGPTLLIVGVIILFMRRQPTVLRAGNLAPERTRRLPPGICQRLTWSSSPSPLQHGRLFLAGDGGAAIGGLWVTGTSAGRSA